MPNALPEPRNLPHLLARIAAGIVVSAVIAAFVVFGVLALAIVIVLALVWYGWFRWHLFRMRRRAARDSTAAQANVIEGEYVVLHDHDTRQ